MSNIFDDTRAAVNQAMATLRAADEVAGDMAYLLKGRLRKVSNADTLKALKRELRDFDMHTGKWKAASRTWCGAWTRRRRKVSA